MNAPASNPSAPPAPPRADAAAWLTILLGTGLRLVGLGQQSFWYDEIHTMRNSWDGPEGGVAGTLLNPHGPLYLALLSGWIRVLGNDEARVRLLSALLGAFGLWLFHRVVAPRIGRDAGRVALLLLALSPFHLWYSQEARNYALLFDLGLIAMAGFLADLDRPTPAHFAGALLGGVGATLANLSGLFVYPIFALLVMARLRAGAARLGRFVVLLVCSLLLLSPWLVAGAGTTGIPHLRATGDESVPIAKGESPPGLAGAVYTLHDFAIGHSLGPTNDELKRDRWKALWPHLPVLIPAALLFAAAALLGLARARRSLQFLLAVWLGTPLLVVAVLSAINLKAPNSRYAFLAFAPWLALLGLGVASIRTPLLRRGLLAGLILVSLAADLLYFSSPHYWKPDNRAASVLLQRESAPEDAIVVYALDYPMLYYLAGTRTMVMPPNSAFESEAASRRWLDTFAAGRTVWLVQCESWWVDRSDHLLAACRSSRRELGAWSFPNLPVYRFRPDSTGTSAR